MRISDIGIIELREMYFHAYHGCFPEEQKTGNTFKVDLMAKVRLGKASVSDRLEDAVDMKGIYDVVSREISKRSDLLENVAGRIAGSVVEEFPQIIGLSVTVSKKCPPVGGECAWSAVTVKSEGYDE